MHAQMREGGQVKLIYYFACTYMSAGPGDGPNPQIL